MFGVVLWSDKQDQNAVIWCEDHGDLAFYRKSDCDCKVPMDAGDWVQFDMQTVHQQRMALNPRLVAEGLYVSLADRLHMSVPPPLPGQVKGSGGEVIAFDPARRKQAAGGVPAASRSSA